MPTRARRFVIEDCDDHDRSRVVVCTTRKSGQMRARVLQPLLGGVLGHEKPSGGARRAGSGAHQLSAERARLESIVHAAHEYADHDLCSRFDDFMA